MRLLVAAIVLLLALPAAAQTPVVVVTVKPLHALVAGVMRDVAQPVLLIEGAASPHTYALKPSAARSLAAADVVVAVGARLETFLDKAAANLGRDTKVVEMARLPGIKTLPVREGGLWEVDHHEHVDHGREAHGHDAVDPHLWLDPANARLLVEAVSDALATADAGNAAAYRANAAATVRELEALDDELRQRLRSLGGRPYLVFHDGYHYFEDRYGLTPAGSVTISPERQPGPRRIQAIRARIAAGGARCLFREPQFSPKLVERLAAETAAKIGVLDAYGSDLPAGPEAYGAIMRGLADSLSRCLAD